MLTSYTHEGFFVIQGKAWSHKLLHTEACVINLCNPQPGIQ